MDHYADLVSKAKEKLPHATVSGDRLCEICGKPIGEEPSIYHPVMKASRHIFCDYTGDRYLKAGEGDFYQESKEK